MSKWSLVWRTKVSTTFPLPSKSLQVFSEDYSCISFFTARNACTPFSTSSVFPYSTTSSKFVLKKDALHSIQTSLSSWWLRFHKPKAVHEDPIHKHKIYILNACLFYCLAKDFSIFWNQLFQISHVLRFAWFHIKLKMLNVVLNLWKHSSSGKHNLVSLTANDSDCM